MPALSAIDITATRQHADHEVLASYLTIVRQPEIGGVLGRSSVVGLARSVRQSKSNGLSQTPAIRHDSRMRCFSSSHQLAATAHAGHADQLLLILLVLLLLAHAAHAAPAGVAGSSYVACVFAGNVMFQGESSLAINFFTAFPCVFSLPFLVSFHCLSALSKTAF